MKPLKPVMAALLAASSLAFALARTAVADELAQPSDAFAREQAVAHDKAFVERLVALAGGNADGDKAVRDDIGARLAKFIQGKEPGRQYLAQALLDDKAGLANVVKETKAWPEANKGQSGKVAALYYVVGLDAGKPPAWATPDLQDKFKEEFKTNTVWSGRLAVALANGKWNTTRQISQSDYIAATDAFLNDAATWAQKILDDARTKGEVHDSIAANDTTKPVPPTVTDNKKNPLDTTGAGWGFDDLYIKGAKVANVYGPHDDGYRTLSMKVYSSKDSKGLPINRIGIVDVTKGETPSNVKYLDTSHPGDTEITLHDGGRPYTVTVGADGSVTLRRTGTTDGDGGGAISTSKSELTSLRNTQIMDGGTVDIGGQPYYVLGQGGHTGSFLFFSKAMLDADPAGNAHPDLMGDVAQVNDGHETVPIQGKPDLGTLDGNPYHLQFNRSTRLWEVQPGKGDTPADAGTGASTATATNQDGGTAPAATLEEAIKLAEQPKNNPNQVWKEEPDRFDGATHAQARIMSNMQDGAKHFEILFAPNLGVDGNAWPVDMTIHVEDVRGLGKYVALQFKATTVYYDLPNLFILINHHTAEPAGTYQVNGPDTGKPSMSGVKSTDILEDGLVHYMKVAPGDKMFAVIRERVAKHAKSSGYLLAGDQTKVVLSVGGADRYVWPDDAPAGEQGAAPNMTGLYGPGSVVGVAAGENAPFPQSIATGSGPDAALVKKAGGAAMYSGKEKQDDGKDATVWSMMLTYKKNGLASRSGRIPLTMFTGKDALPSYGMQGLPNVEVGGNPLLGMLDGSDAKRGAVAMYLNVQPDSQGGQNLKNKVKNCLGVVLWWGGVQPADALAACKGDSKLP